MCLYATGGTFSYLQAHGVECRRVNRIREGSPSILDMIEDGSFQLVVNTPGRDRSHSRDGFLIRRAAAERSIPVLTAIDTAQAVIQARVMGHVRQLRPVDVSELQNRESSETE